MRIVRPWKPFALAIFALALAGCSDSSDRQPLPPPEPAPSLLAGAASYSLLPTVAGGRAYLSDAPGWPAREALDPDNPGVFIEAWDQGRVDVGNGRSDSAWVHDDIRATALALSRDGERVIMIMADTYSFFSPDISEIVNRVRSRIPPEWQEAPVLVSATHNHHGPDTAFSINDDWFSLLADQIAFAAEDAVASMQAAQLRTASGEHGYGVDDVRDPIIRDPRLNVIAVDALESGEAIATLVQWTSHPESTLGWHPPADAAGLEQACAAKGWEGGDCTAEGRYLTADFPGVLRERIAAQRGGETLFFNGPLGNQVGPGASPTWVVTDEHPVGDGRSVPEGAAPLTECDDRPTYLCRSFAKTESIGTELANAVSGLLDAAQAVEVSQLRVHIEPFFTRLTNIGFRLLIADGDIGWQDIPLYNCTDQPLSADNCSDSGGALEDDPFITPVLGSQISAGDVIRSQLAHLDFGDVGILWMPGELPPELVHGLPDDFASAPAEKYYREPHLHAVGADYVLPGHLLSLADESLTLTVGLGTDQIGYYVPVADYRLRCLDLVLTGGASCADLAARGVIESPEYISGATCQAITDDPAALTALGDDAEAVATICRYGQGLGRELGEPEGHYEETNAAGWDMVDDIWAAARRLYKTQNSAP
ncbi:hypothetical protein F0M18_09860 [Pseudohalioglobus sediminis]|uniref:Neutral/alkaline non-lysosomal ceramidase N-terminal domain-containing protein n=1 Tax=Pseudohalioglobus sediminis TaxID=2606449 RepID=A0A5B0WXQ2_9GAMM|nr:hypothetical protein [Pseudohalioglobus sediminis]KAA1191830.1 hypothetical protein F0M18_09860 [Pseudohalioglobus sediminis]